MPATVRVLTALWQRFNIGVMRFLVGSAASDGDAMCRTRGQEVIVGVGMMNDVQWLVCICVRINMRERPLGQTTHHRYADADQ